MFVFQGMFLAAHLCAFEQRNIVSVCVFAEVHMHTGYTPPPSTGLLLVNHRAVG